MNVIEASDLSKNYGNDVGIKNINLEIKKGEVFWFHWTKWCRKINFH